MTNVSYRNFTGNAADNYQRDFVPAIGTPVSGELIKAAALQPGERVLDVACGTGLIARLAAQQVGPTGSVTGVDISPDMIAKAEGIPSTGARIDWQQGDATDIAQPDDSYDVVTCQMGLMFMEDRAKAIAEMRRVLTPGGRVVINTPGTIQRPFELMEQAIVDNINPELGGFVRAVFSIHDPDTVAALLRDANFDNVEGREYIATFQLPEPVTFVWQYINLTPMGPLVAQAAEEAKTAMDRQVAETWAPFVVDGGTPVAQPMVIATGVK